jgi:phosphate transport system protein
LAVNIAEAAQRYVTHPPVKPLIDIPRMANLAQSMLHDALDAFVSGDTQMARHVLDRDDTGRAEEPVFRGAATHMLATRHDRAGH